MSPRPTHYQILGVSPTAAADEVERAFARESSVFRPHVFGGLTEVCVAYQTLRDPIKRRAYDASIGLVREPGPRKLPQGVRGAATAETMVRAAPVEQRAPPPPSPPEPRSPPTRSALPLGPGADLNVRPEPTLRRGDPPHLPLADVLDAEVRPIDWRRAGITLGGFVLAACVLGGLAGWWSASGISEASPPKQAEPLSIPQSQPAAAPPIPDLRPATASPAPEARIDRPGPANPGPVRTERNPIAPPEPVAVAVQPQPDEAEPNAAEPVVDAALASTTTAAAMPLPNRVIARTIDRIGYSCGSVTSATPVEGAAPGVYKIGCSSGQFYQAKLVNGRYRFRRWGRP